VKLTDDRPPTAGDAPPPSPEAIIPEARKRGRRRRLGIGIAIVLIVATAASVGGVIGSGGSHPSTNTSPVKSGALPTWTKLTPARHPAARTRASMAYDTATHQLVLFGGDNRTGTTLSTTWVFTGTTWTKLFPTTSPTPRWGASMAYDPASRQLVLSGGLGLGDSVLPHFTTWVWNGNTWKRLPTARGTTPVVGVGKSMAYDAATRQLVLFGGSCGHSLPSGTSVWNGTTWKTLSTAKNPPACGGASMAYDRRTRQLVLFGGNGTGEKLSTTWAWTGSTWKKLTPPKKPMARAQASMAYTASGQLVLFGGFGPPGGITNLFILPVVFPTAWAWDGTTWKKLTTARNPPARYDASMAYDAATRQLVLFGGDPGTSQYDLSTTWVRRLSKA
jgi:hypothetical protein